MPKILFLDDSEERITKTLEFHGKYQRDVTVARTALEAIVALQDDVFDVLSLDHDLGGEVFVDSGREDCGMEVVRAMCDNKELIASNPVVVVHSWNIPAAKDMVIKLKRYFKDIYRVPFGYEGYAWY